MKNSLSDLFRITLVGLGWVKCNVFFTSSLWIFLKTKNSISQSGSSTTTTTRPSVKWLPFVCVFVLCSAAVLVSFWIRDFRLVCPYVVVKPCRSWGRWLGGWEGMEVGKSQPYRGSYDNLSEPVRRQRGRRRRLDFACHDFYESSRREERTGQLTPWSKLSLESLVVFLSGSVLPRVCPRGLGWCVS